MAIKITDEMREAARDEIVSFGALAVYSPINVSEAVLQRITPIIEAQALERAAQVAEERTLGPASGWSQEQADWWGTGCCDMQMAIAAAIRNLIPKEGAE